MEIIGAAAQFLKNNRYHNELMHLFSGFLFIFIFNLVYLINVTTVPNYSEASPTQKLIFFIVIAYFLSRISREIGGVLIRLIISIVRSNRWSRLVEYNKSFLEYVNKVNYKVPKEKFNTRYNFEVVEELKDSPYLTSMYLDADLRYIMSCSFLGFFTILVFISLFYQPNINKLYLYLTLGTLILYTCFALFSRYKSLNKLIDIYTRGKGTEKNDA